MSGTLNRVSTRGCQISSATFKHERIVGEGERLNHPIVEESFAIIDREVGDRNLNAWEYAIARRVIHTTADFEDLNLLRFSYDAIDSGIACLRERVPSVTDVGTVKQGITTMLTKTFNNLAIAAVEQVLVADAGKTHTETGMLKSRGSRKSKDVSRKWVDGKYGKIGRQE